MTALAGGLLAALAWATATLLAARSSRTIGVASTLAWVMVAGLAFALPVAIVFGGSERPHGAALAWLALAGAGNVGGLACVYAGVRHGHVGLVSCLSSTEGALAALGSIATGERPGPLTLAGAALAAAGVAMVASGGRPAAGAGRIGPAVGFGLASAVLFAVNLLATGEASQDVAAAWTGLPARIVGVGVLVVALSAGMRPQRPGRPMVAAAVAGVCEVLGVLAFAVGARQSTAVASVMASQLAVLVALGGYLLLGERLSRRQVAALGVVAAGVALVAVGSA